MSNKESDLKFTNFYTLLEWFFNVSVRFDYEDISIITKKLFIIWSKQSQEWFDQNYHKIKVINSLIYIFNFILYNKISFYFTRTKIKDQHN